MITLTQSAINEIVRQNKTNMIRFGVRAGGCNGYSYVFEYTDKINEKDNVFEFDNVKVLVDPKSVLYISGTTIDFISGISGHGFKIDNPNISQTCGCKVSFSVNR